MIIRQIRPQTGLGLAIVASLVSACASSPPAPRVEANPPVAAKTLNDDWKAQFAWSVGEGRSSLEGTIHYAAAKQKWSCQRLSVALMPDAPLARERLIALYGSTDFAATPAADVLAKSARVGAPPFASYMRETQCDAQDHFTFAALPGGTYYVIARVHNPRAGADDSVALMQKAIVRGDGTTKVKIPAF